MRNSQQPIWFPASKPARLQVVRQISPSRGLAGSGLNVMADADPVFADVIADIAGTARHR